MTTNSYSLNTPLFESHALRAQGQSVYFKMDCDQPTGSFKIRGMENLCRYHAAQGKRKFLGSSGGNAGYSLAYVGYKMGLEVKIVVPEKTPEFMREKIRRIGAEVEVHGTVWDEAHAHALKLAETEGYEYVSPFDDPLLWEGHASMIDECKGLIPQPARIVLSVGGGGLLCGVLEGLQRNGWQDTEVIAVETEGAASLYRSVEAGKLIELARIESIASSLGAKKVAVEALRLSQDRKVKPFLVSDDEALRAMDLFLEEYHRQVEPACGAALAYGYFHLGQVEGTTLVVVCGGVNVQPK